MPKKIAKKKEKKEKNVFAGVGYSRADDPYKAGYEAAKIAMDNMTKDGGKKPTFALVFCSGGKYGKNDKTIQKLVDGAHSVFKDTQWVGCTTCGEIVTDQVLEGSCVACIISSDYLQVGIGIGDGVHKNPEEAGRKAAQEAILNLKREKIVTPYLRYLAEKRKTSAELMKQYSYFTLLFSPGLTLDAVGMEDKVVRGVYDTVGRQIPVIGGAAGDDARLLQNYEFTNGKVYKDAAIVTAISTGVLVGFGFGHGYVSTGDTYVVTKSDGCLVHELNKKPAAEVYANILGMKLDELWGKKTDLMMKATPLAKLAIKYFSTRMDPKAIPFLSIAVTNPFGIIDIHDNITIRIARAIKGKSIGFQQMIPNGMVLNKLKIDPKKVLKAELNAIEDSKKDAGADPKIIFIFDCSLRKLFVLEKGKIEKIIKDVKKSYPNSILIGCGSMGEFIFNRKAEPMATGASVSVGIISDKLVTE